MANIKRMPVAFNLDDPDQLMMYLHGTERVFSSYIKRLIWADIKGEGRTQPVISQPSQDSLELNVEGFI